MCLAVFTRCRSVCRWSLLQWHCACVVTTLGQTSSTLAQRCYNALRTSREKWVVHISLGLHRPRICWRQHNMRSARTEWETHQWVQHCSVEDLPSFLLPPPKEVMFSVVLVCFLVGLSVSRTASKLTKGYAWNLYQSCTSGKGPIRSISGMILITIRNQDPDYDPVYTDLLEPFTRCVSRPRNNPIIWAEVFSLFFNSFSAGIDIRR